MTQSLSNILHIQDITKKFGKNIAVNSISFQVKQGEIFGFLGPNGAGKTTTIRLITGILTPDAGSIHIGGIDIRQEPLKAKLKIGVIPEMGDIYVDLSAKKNIILAGKFYGLPRRELEKKADILLKKFELFDRKDDIVRTFSKGMKQRISIASALVHDPQILFLDEPTSGLDVQSQRLIKNIIKEMNQKGTTIFLTTHNIEEANILCQRVAIINKGKIAAIDSPERLRKTFEENQTVNISFDKSIDASLIEKNNFVSKSERAGDKWKLYTYNPDALVKNLVGIAEKDKLKIETLEICGASLEDVFLKLTEVKDHVN